MILVFDMVFSLWAFVDGADFKQRALDFIPDNDLNRRKYSTHGWLALRRSWP
jgi:hypothetical protein